MGVQPQSTSPGVSKNPLIGRNLVLKSTGVYTTTERPSTGNGEPAGFVLVRLDKNDRVLGHIRLLKGVEQRAKTLLENREAARVAVGQGVGFHSDQPVFQVKRVVTGSSGEAVDDDPPASDPEPVEKVIRERKNPDTGETEYCVFSENTNRNFGCYPTRPKAKERLRQIHRFSDKNASLDDLDVDVDDVIDQMFVLEDGEARPIKKRKLPRAKDTGYAVVIEGRNRAVGSEIFAEDKEEAIEVAHAVLAKNRAACGVVVGKHTAMMGNTRVFRAVLRIWDKQNAARVAR